AVRHLIGFVPQELTFHDDMSVKETLLFYARLKKVEDGFDFEPLLKRLALWPHLAKPVRDLSGGLKQRLALAIALLNDPPLLVLDEPTSNLDVQARGDFLALLLELKRSGKTLLFSSHRPEEVMTLADRVLVLADGHLVADCPPAELSQQLGQPTTLHLFVPADGVEPALTALTRHGLPASRNGRGILVQVAPGNKAEPIRILHAADISVEDFTLE
ncbi:MAG TPA: ABC transporter ATP-binding protein, partial [Anaerolineae bacterium]